MVSRLLGETRDSNQAQRPLRFLEAKKPSWRSQRRAQLSGCSRVTSSCCPGFSSAPGGPRLGSRHWFLRRRTSQLPGHNPVQALTSSMRSQYVDKNNFRSGRLVFDRALDSQRRTIGLVGQRRTRIETKKRNQTKIVDINEFRSCQRRNFVGNERSGRNGIAL
jgi:hypothetical protein